MTDRSEYMRQYRLDHAVERAEYNRQYYAENSEYFAEYRAEHADERKEYNRQYQKDNPDKKRASEAKRRALKLKAGGSFTDADIALIYARQEGKCAYCGIDLNGKYHIDHVYPISRGGSNWPENLACSCQKCNQSKSDKTLEEWLA